jgi:hypothetical protein
VKVTVAVEIGDRTVAEQIVTQEDFRGDYRAAVGECATRIELATYGPQQSQGGFAFDTVLQMRPQV